MFTGLVEAIGELIERKATSGGVRLRLASPLADELSPGDSLAVNGVCLTVILAENGEVHADGHVRHRVREHERALEHLLRRDPVRHVDDLHVWGDRLDDAVTGADEIVLEAEVAQESDEHAPTLSGLRQNGFDKPIEIVR